MNQNASFNKFKTTLRETVVDEAKKYLGTPYLWGGENKEGVDCSGLTKVIYKSMGADIGRTTYEQIKQGKEISKSEIQPGDLVFFGTKNNPNHVGICINNKEFINATKSGEVVKISKLYAREDYLTARRIIN